MLSGNLGLSQTFQSGVVNGSLCLIIEVLLDQDIEDTEVFEVALNSTDRAVLFTNSTVVITIDDANIGKFRAFSESKYVGNGLVQWGSDARGITILEPATYNFCVQIFIPQFEMYFVLQERCWLISPWMHSLYLNLRWSLECVSTSPLTPG